jgi:hypothetical protein
MWIIPKERERFNDIYYSLRPNIERSRFTAKIEDGCLKSWNKLRNGIKLSCIRLRNKKDYCGQHPGECLINPFERYPRKHPISIRLEGLDWVGFNDGLNDMLDRLNVSADVFSFNREAGKITKHGARRLSRFYIRRGRCRYLEYTQARIERDFRPLVFWTDSDNYADYCGQQAPRSKYPSGTPGLPCWTLEEEKQLCLEPAIHHD